MGMPTRFNHAGGALTPSAIRDRIMETAGLTHDVQARLVKRAVHTAVKHLKATKPVVLNGEITQVPDNMAQLRAAQMLIDVTGASPSKDSNQTVLVKVDINLPDWAKAEPCNIDVQSCVVETPDKSGT